MRARSVLLFLVWLLPAGGCALHAPERPPLATVAELDSSRYLGKWYEIASLPNRFQRGCVATNATYSRIDAATLRVVNECRDGTLDGGLRRVEGKAWAPDGDPAKLKVQFFWPFRGDYQVIALDDQYRWALVGHPSRAYLWILAREPTLAPAIYDDLLRRAAAQGFDVAKVQRTTQAPR
jgi:apolipoprotein D and lipocalin family protein